MACARLVQVGWLGLILSCFPCILLHRSGIYLKGNGSEGLPVLTPSIAASHQGSSEVNAGSPHSVLQNRTGDAPILISEITSKLAGT